MVTREQIIQVQTLKLQRITFVSQKTVQPISYDPGILEFHDINKTLTHEYFNARRWAATPNIQI